MLESADRVDINCAPGEGGATPLFVVCCTGHAALVQLLLDSQARPDVALKNGQTPLMKVAGPLHISYILHLTTTSSHLTSHISHHTPHTSHISHRP